MLEFGGFGRWFAHLFERWPPGVPPDPKKCENASIFNPKTNIFQIKRRAFRLVFKHIWKENRRHSTKKMVEQNLFGRKRRAFRFVFLQFWAITPQAQYKKTGQHSVQFFNIFGEKTDDTVPTNRSGVISQLKRASIPFCFFAYF